VFESKIPEDDAQDARFPKHKPQSNEQLAKLARTSSGWAMDGCRPARGRWESGFTRGRSPFSMKLTRRGLVSSQASIEQAA
jgi:hypothetical protein